MPRAVSIGIAKPTVGPPVLSVRSLPAVIIPTTWPSVSTSAPPESPGWMFASVWIIPVSCSEVPLGFEAVIDRSTAVTEPLATAGSPPRPSAFPMPATLSPIATVEVSGVIVSRFDASASWSSATSWEGSTPTTVAV